MRIISKLQSFFTRKQPLPLVDVEAIVDQRIELGFLTFTPKSKQEAVRQQLIESVRNNYLDSDWSDDCVSADKRRY